MQLSAMPIAAPRNPEDLAEVAGILALGLQRLSDRKSSQISRREAETPLDCGAAPTATHRRHAIDQGISGHRTLRHRAPGRLRISGQTLQVVILDRPGDHRHQMEWPGVLRPQASPGIEMTPPRAKHRKGSDRG